MSPNDRKSPNCSFQMDVCLKVFFSPKGDPNCTCFFFSHLQYVTKTCQVSFPTKQSDVLQQRSLHLSQPKTQLTWGWFEKKRSQKLLHPPFSWGSFFFFMFFFHILASVFPWSTSWKPPGIWLADWRAIFDDFHGLGAGWVRWCHMNEPSGGAATLNKFSVLMWRP